MSSDNLFSDDDVCKAIRSLKDAEGSTYVQIRNYLLATNDKLRDVPNKQLEAGIKRVTFRGIQAGTMTKSRNGLRIRLSKGSDDGGSKMMRRRRGYSRRRRGRCRVHRVNRPPCSRYKKRCCRRRRRCRASVHRSKRPVCSRYKHCCCRRVRRR